MSLDIKYKNLYNITLIIKNDPYDDDGFDSGTYKVDYENAFFRIDGGYFIVEVVNEKEILGNIIEMKKIKSYKIWQ